MGGILTDERLDISQDRKTRIWTVAADGSGACWHGRISLATHREERSRCTKLHRLDSTSPNSSRPRPDSSRQETTQGSPAGAWSKSASGRPATRIKPASPTVGPCYIKGISDRPCSGRTDHRREPDKGPSRNQPISQKARSVMPSAQMMPALWTCRHHPAEARRRKADVKLALPLGKAEAKCQTSATKVGSK